MADTRYSIEYTVRLKPTELIVAEQIADEKFEGHLSSFVRDALNQLYSTYKTLTRSDFIELFGIYKTSRKQLLDRYKKANRQYETAMFNIRLMTSENDRIDKFMKILKTTGSDVIRFAMWTYDS